MKDVLAAEAEKTSLGKVEEDLKFENDRKYPSTETSFVSSGTEAAECGKSDVACALDISDSELLCQKQKKPHALGALFAMDNMDDSDVDVAGCVSPAATTSSTSTSVTASTIPVPPVGQAPVGIPEADSSSVVRVVRSFPLPLDQLHRPVVGPPSLDQDTIRRMEQLQIPVSLPQEDVERVARLQQLKQLSCRE